MENHFEHYATKSVDPDRLRRHLAELQEELGADVVVELIGVFLDELPSQVHALKYATREGDVESALRIAHRLRGSVEAIGGHGAAVVCRDFEAIGNSGSLDGSPAILDRLDSELEHIRCTLSAFRAVNGAPPTEY